MCLEKDSEEMARSTRTHGWSAVRVRMQEESGRRLVCMCCFTYMLFGLVQHIHND